MHSSLAQSENLFEKIKKFFLNNERREFVIKITDLPIDKWETVLVNSVDEMCRVRLELTMARAYFAGFTNFEGNYVMYFSDRNMFKCVQIDSNEVLEFEDRTFRSYRLDKLIDEIDQIQG